MARVYPNAGAETYLDEADFDVGGSSGTKAIKAGEENVIGEFTVPAQEVYRWGYGSPQDERNQGFAYADIKDDSNSEVPGTLWLVQTDAPGDNRIVAKRISASKLRGDISDTNTQIPVPEQGQYPFVGENSKLRLVFVPRNDVTIDASNSEIALPTTRARPEEV
jgi:hypothetical protein